MDEKEIAKEILVKCIDQGVIRWSSTGKETPVDAICETYKQILKTVKED